MADPVGSGTGRGVGLTATQQKCPACKGRGRDINDWDGEYEICKPCGGTGVRETREDSALGAVRRFQVPSETEPRKTYLVDYFGGVAVCNCLGSNSGDCKHAKTIRENLMQTESTAIALREDDAPPQALTIRRPATLYPTDQEFQVIEKMAKHAAKLSGKMIPEWIKDEATALGVMLSGRELGIPAFSSLRHMYNIHGRCEPDAQAMMGIVRANIPDAQFQFTDYTHELVTCIFTRPGQQPIKVSYSAADAKKSGQLGKGGPWTTYTRDMLAWNAVRRCCKLGAPDAANAIEARLLMVESEPSQSIVAQIDTPAMLEIPASAMCPEDAEAVKRCSVCDRTKEEGHAEDCRYAKPKQETPVTDVAPTPTSPAAPQAETPATWREKFCQLAGVNPNDPLEVCRAFEKAQGAEITPSNFDKLFDTDFHAAFDRLNNDLAGAAATGSLSI